MSDGMQVRACWVATGLRTRCEGFIDGDQRGDCFYPECLPPTPGSRYGGATDSPQYDGAGNPTGRQAGSAGRKSSE